MRKFTIVTLTIALLIMTGNAANAQRVIVSWLGNGIEGFSGDGGPGYSANVYRPNDLCLNSAHDLLVADMGNGRIRKVSQATGIVTTIAGGGSSTADGIPATAALLRPQYICVDGADNIYFTTDHYVKRVDAASGLITTVAGTGTGGFSGDLGPATAAMLSGPQGICIDAAGNLYVVDQGNNRIREIAAATGIITTIAGSATAGYSGDGAAATAAELENPISICVNASGDVYFSDQMGSYIRKISGATGLISHVAGNGGSASGNGGPATAAGVGEIWGLCVDGGGDIYCDDYSCACRKITVSTGIINVVVGSLIIDGYNGDGMDAMLAELNFPHGLCIDATGNIFIADINNVRIRKAIQLTHTPSFAFGKGLSITPCPGITQSINGQLAVGDMDAGQLETWSVISSPAMGTLSGFPYAVASNGTDSLTTPSGLSYTPAAGYMGADSFKIRVTDGILSDTVTVYVKVTILDPGPITGSAIVCVGSDIGLAVTLPGGTWSVVNGHASVPPYSGDVTGITAGVDTVVYTVVGACTVSTSTTVTVNLTPDAGTISGPDTICVGTPVDFTETIPGGSWDVGVGFATIDAVTGTATGIVDGAEQIVYYVTGTGPYAGCSSMATFDIAIDPAPDAGTILGSATVAAGSSVLLFDAITGGTWSTTNSAISTVDASGNVLGISPGTDSVVYSFTNSCGTANTYFIFTVLHGITTGLNNASAGEPERIVVTPNPSKGNFTINLSSASTEPVSITVTNIVGEKMKEINGNTNKPINVSLNVPAGVYLLNASTLHDNYAYKIVVE